MERIKLYFIIFIVLFFVISFIDPALSVFLLGSAVCCAALAAIIWQSRLVKRGATSTGKIKGYELDQDDGRTPSIEFTTQAGEVINKNPFLHTTTDLTKFRSNKKQVDREVSIIYDPLHPERFIIAEEKGTNFWIFLFFCLGGLTIAVCSLASFLGYIRI